MRPSAQVHVRPSDGLTYHTCDNVTRKNCLKSHKFVHCGYLLNDKRILMMSDFTTFKRHVKNVKELLMYLQNTLCFTPFAGPLLGQY